ncbi:AbfB domain-containing protein [Streptomyces sp. NBC_00285]|uniref:AbfB domain-containing protein n=1 Tax=Streptomyces sp. NBC_00285 TaxID=2975700 RepID=UPI002E2E6E95|nr:AbfB domain-containing protein [Streptomyces sp. NBC_00285]
MTAPADPLDDHCLRHRDFLVRADASNGTATFTKDATYCARPISVTGSVSLESFNYPRRYLRHYNFGLRIDTFQDIATFWRSPSCCISSRAPSTALQRLLQPR